MYLQHTELHWHVLVGVPVSHGIANYFKNEGISMMRRHFFPLLHHPLDTIAAEKFSLISFDTLKSLPAEDWGPMLSQALGFYRCRW